MSSNILYVSWALCGRSLKTTKNTTQLKSCCRWEPNINFGGSQRIWKLSFKVWEPAPLTPGQSDTFRHTKHRLFPKAATAAHMFPPPLPSSKPTSANRCLLLFEKMIASLRLNRSRLWVKKHFVTGHLASIKGFCPRPKWPKRSEEWIPEKYYLQCRFLFFGR